MRVVYRGTIGWVRGFFSFGASGCLHGCVLAWVILGGAGQPPERAQSIYDREIRPYEKRIVWYSLREKLPEIAPADTQQGAGRTRARVKAPQTMVAGARDDARPAPLIWAPEPELAAPREMPLPNVVAVSPPKVVRPFVAPKRSLTVAAPIALPDAPRVAAADGKAALPLLAAPKLVRPFVAPKRSLAVAAPIALPEAPHVTAVGMKAVLPLPEVAPKLVRPFVTPPVKAPAPPPRAVPLPEAPRVAAADGKAALPLPAVAPGGPRRTFAPPPNVRMQKQAMLPLPEGPRAEMVVEPKALPFPDAGPRPQARTFTAPPVKPRAASVVVLPAAPEVALVSAKQRSLTVAALIGRLPERPEAAPVISEEPPAISGVPTATGKATLAIVGLNPARTTEVPAPPASRAAGFSAGPEPRAEGDTGARSGAPINVPGLVVNGGAKDTQPTLAAPFSPTSRENLLAAARIARAAAPKVPAEDRGKRAAVPDPRFAGRVVYTMAIQMPNVTSFSGSWLVWFAERAPDPQGPPGPAPRQMRPPEVVRKVDPKYVAAAVEDRVEGTVRLFGVIAKNGHVGGIAMLRQLDERLDRSAREALAKWEFTPALRDGVAVDVDAIFEIPFHLAPRPKP